MFQSGFSDGKGVSLVLLNSEKGRTLFEKVLENINAIESNTTECMQPNLSTPSNQASGRTNFMNDIVKQPFKKVVVHYKISDNNFVRLKKTIKKSIKKVLAKQS